MDTTQYQMLRLLKLTIHGSVPNFNEYSPVNGEKLFNLALQHNVCSFLYPTVIKYHKELMIDELIMKRWKEVTLCIAARQMTMVNEINTMLSLFEDNGIPVISLKGLALKLLYPQPELRNMGDLDLLVCEKEIKKSIEFLSTQGYQPNAKDLNDPKYMHIGMKKTGSFSIELHRTLWHPAIMKKKDVQLWLNSIWQNKRQINMGDIRFTALSIEDELINLIVHLARHLMGTGARLCQLCDFVLFVKTYWNRISKEYIEQTLISMNLYAFYRHLLSTCSFYLGLSVSNVEIYKENKSDILINLIYNSTKHRKTTNEAEHNTNSNLWPFAYILKIRRQGIEIIKGFLKGVPFVTRSTLFIRSYKAKAYNLRSIGLYLKY